MAIANSDQKTVRSYFQEGQVYAKRPFAGPEAVLGYLPLYTHRVAIATSRLLAMDENGITFKWKDYRAKGRTRLKTMTLATDEIIRRFLIHVLPHGFHRIRHYGWMANANRVAKLAQAREPLAVDPADAEPAQPYRASSDGPEVQHIKPVSPWTCTHCAVPMIIIAVLEKVHAPRGPPFESAS